MLSATARNGWAFIRFLIFRFRHNRGGLNAAALTYTTLFAVVPMMTVTYAMLASIPSFSGIGRQLEDLIFSHFVPNSGEALQDYLSQFATQAQALTLVGVGFLGVTAFMMLKSIEGAFNHIWKVSIPRKGLASFLLYWAVLSLGPLLLGAGFVMSSYLISLPLLVDTEELRIGRELVLELAPFILSTAAFTLIYAAVPNCRVKLSHAAIGGVLAALLFEAAKSGFTLFVSHFPSYKLIYGAFAAVPLFLAWIYITWLIVLFGAELVRALGTFHLQTGEVDERQARLLAFLSLLHRLWREQQRGGALPESSLMKELPHCDPQQWREYVQLLESMALVQRNAQGHYFLVRDMGRLSLADLSGQLPWPLAEQAGSPAGEQNREPGREQILPGWQMEVQQRLEGAEASRQEALNISLGTLFTESGNHPRILSIKDSS
jgi:membrane protein